MENENNKEVILNIVDYQNCQFNFDKIRETYEFYLIKNEEPQKKDFKPESNLLDDAQLVRSHCLPLDTEEVLHHSHVLEQC